MSRAHYRISEITIEGFRGFTTEQKFSIGERNVFLFGQNGHGKSSVVEAIRWCLFGSISGSDIEVRNTFYPQQDCRVVLGLTGERGRLTVERELRPGHDRSRQTILDSGGKEVLERDALPQLTRLGAHDSTYVIFAAQHAAGRQITASISEFGKVLCLYLRLDAVLELLRQLDRLYDEKFVQADELGKGIDEVTQTYRNKRSMIDSQLTVLLANPPWGDSVLPTRNETVQRIGDFLRELAKLVDASLPDHAEPAELLQLGEQWIESLSSRDATAVQTKINELAQRIKRLEQLSDNLRSANSLIAANEVFIDRFRQQLAAASSVQSRSEIEEQIGKLEHALDRHTAAASIAERTEKFCTDYAVSQCPACGTPFDGLALSERARSLGVGDTHFVRDLDQARVRLRALDEANAEITRLTTDNERQAILRQSAVKEIVALVEIPDGNVTAEDVQTHVTRMQRSLSELTRGLDEAHGRKQTLLGRVRSLRQELSYHDYRDRQSALAKNLDQGTRDAHELLRDYQSLLQQVDVLRKLTRKSFRAALDRAIPPLDEMFTEVYQRLTQQRSYELVRIYHDPEKVGELELRVASHRSGAQNFAINVLNGQAAKALHLVPYLVFSRFQKDILELDLLLIDDPSESFDTSHVRLLVDELRSAADHAQLIVASHEEEKFLPELKEHFSPEAYSTMIVKNFDPGRGPAIEQT